MSITWPSLSDEQIEAKAAEFRQEAVAALGLLHVIEVPVEQIAELYLGYQLDFVESIEEFPDDVIGGIDFDTKVILVNASIESHIGRYCFTIAHELGHHILHRDLFYANNHVEKIMCRGGDHRPVEEVQADRFAEALLMPEQIVRKYFRKITRKRLFTRRNRFVIAAEIIKASGLVNVSTSAMAVRLAHLDLICESSLVRRAKKIIMQLKR